jgi:hypothetical protein
MARTDLLAAAATAGLVGGLADWFAVTALFRRPPRLAIHRISGAEGAAGVWCSSFSYVLLQSFSLLVSIPTKRYLLSWIN